VLIGIDLVKTFPQKKRIIGVCVLNAVRVVTKERLGDYFFTEHLVKQMLNLILTG
jgi:hypothetical protein